MVCIKIKASFIALSLSFISCSAVNFNAIEFAQSILEEHVAHKAEKTLKKNKRKKYIQMDDKLFEESKNGGLRIVLNDNTLQADVITGLISCGTQKLKNKSFNNPSLNDLLLKKNKRDTLTNLVGPQIGRMATITVKKIDSKTGSNGSRLIKWFKNKYSKNTPQCVKDVIEIPKVALDLIAPRGVGKLIERELGKMTVQYGRKIIP